MRWETVNDNKTERCEIRRRVRLSRRKAWERGGVVSTDGEADKIAFWWRQIESRLCWRPQDIQTDWGGHVSTERLLQPVWCDDCLPSPSSVPAQGYLCSHCDINSAYRHGEWTHTLYNKEGKDDNPEESVKDRLIKPWGLPNLHQPALMGLWSWERK